MVNAVPSIDAVSDLEVSTSCPSDVVLQAWASKIGGEIWLERVAKNFEVAVRPCLLVAYFAEWVTHSISVATLLRASEG